MNKIIINIRIDDNIIIYYSCGCTGTGGAVSGLTDGTGKNLASNIKYVSDYVSADPMGLISLRNDALAHFQIDLTLRQSSAVSIHQLLTVLCAQHAMYLQTLGSTWIPVGGESQTFTAVADSTANRGSGANLATMTTTPPAAPNVFTAFLMGDAKYKYTLLPQVDAPETGPCKPSM